VLLQDPAFSFEEIDMELQHIIVNEARWQGYFAACGVLPFTLVYEDLAAAPEEAARRILEYLGTPVPSDLSVGPIRWRKMADATTDEWVRLFTALKEGTAHRHDGRAEDSNSCRDRYQG
jgi:LPS sulfotransferase NodH